MTYTLYPQTESQQEALKALIESMNIPFDTSIDENYNANFNAKMERGKKEIAEGKGIKMSV